MGTPAGAKPHTWKPWKRSFSPNSVILTPTTIRGDASGWVSGQDPAASMDESDKPSLLERLSALLMREPEDREQLLKLLHSAFARNLLDADALSIIDRALHLSDMQLRAITLP